MLSGAEKALLAILVLVLMTGMGASLTVDNFRAVLRRPKALLIGLASQFGWMPLTAYALATLFNLPPAMALGLLIVGCTPGGTTSNLFTYFARADVALSVSMTCVSTLVAVVAMPVLLGLYGNSLMQSETHALTIPYGSIASTLAVVLLPVGLGLWIRKRSERAAMITEKVGAFSGVAVLLLLIGSSLVHHGDRLLQTGSGMYLAAASLGAVGLGAGWTVARVLGLNKAERRAVSFETGIQNSPLALGIIVASFEETEHLALMSMPLLYALLVLITSSVAAAGFVFVDAKSAPRD